MHRPTDKTEASALYERGVSVHCDREDVCGQREDICRQRLGNAQTTEVGALFNRALSMLCCECVLTATETLRGEGMRASSGGIYAETTSREYTDNDRWEKEL